MKTQWSRVNSGRCFQLFIVDMSGYLQPENSSHSAGNMNISSHKIFMENFSETYFVTVPGKVFTENT